MSQSEQWEPGSWDELFPGRFLKACHLRCSTAELRIERVYAEIIDGKQAAILQFASLDGVAQTDFGLNKTNGKIMRELFGPNLADWRGKRIVVGESKVEHGRERGKPCIRIVGSPDIERDAKVVIDFHTKMIKPFVLLVRAYQDIGRSFASRISNATTVEQLAAIASDISASSASDGDKLELRKAWAARHAQITDKQ